MKVNRNFEKKKTYFTRPQISRHDYTMINRLSRVKISLVLIFCLILTYSILLFFIIDWKARHIFLFRRTSAYIHLCYSSFVFTYHHVIYYMIILLFFIPMKFDSKCISFRWFNLFSRSCLESIRIYLFDNHKWVLANKYLFFINMMTN